MEPSTSSERASSSEAHCGQEHSGLSTWNPEHTIFLSHSGKQKEFVRQLCKDLEAETHRPFFDEQSNSLPMGERFAPLIFKAAQQCVVAVVVLSKDYLTTKWPMLELVEFVKAKKSHNQRITLFPLFYKLSPEDLKVECIESRWKDAWTKIVIAVPDQVRPRDDTHNHLTLSLCKEAIRELRGANGLKFELFRSEVAYREAIVKEISLIVAPDLLDDTSDVIGKERLCQVLGGMFVEDTIEGSNLWGTHKLGLYGMGGLGKTTMSRALCMFYFKQFNGRVCHVELGSRSPLDLQKLVLTKLLRINKEVVDRVHTVHEGRKLLKDHTSHQRVFLAIDNITNDHESRTEALAYLESGFHLGSMILITSRSLDIVKEFFPSHPNAIFCKGVASLSKDEARLIFLQRASPQRKLESLSVEELETLNECVGQCRFSLVNGKRQYHPLALRALADYYYKFDCWNVLTWREHLGDLDKLRPSNASSDVFGILGLQLQSLALKEKLLFLDLCLYTKTSLVSDFRAYEVTLRWLVDIHEDTPTTIALQLQSLKRSGIINFHSNRFGEVQISIHDLYLEFAKWYVVDGEGSRWCVYHAAPTSSVPRNTVSADPLPYVLKRTDPSSFELQRIRLERLTCATFPFRKVQEWCNVVVLQIRGCSNLKVLDLHGLSCLRFLELVKLTELERFCLTESQPQSSMGSIGTLVSLQHVVLESLSSLKRLPDFSLCPSLKTFRMLFCEKFLPEPPRFMGCSQLVDLRMHWRWQWRLEKFKLHTLTSLNSLWLWNNGFDEFGGSSAWFGPKYFGVRKLAGLEACSQLRNLDLGRLPITSLRGVEKLTKLQHMSIFRCEYLWDIPDVFALADLKHLFVRGGAFLRFPGVERLLQLECLQFRICDKLTSLPDLDHLPNLTRVIVMHCRAVKVKPRVPRGCRVFFEV